MASSSLLSKLLKKPSMTKSSMHLTAFQSLCPKLSPCVPENLEKEPTNLFFAAYPTFPQLYALPPIFLREPNSSLELKFEKGPRFDQMVACSNLGVIIPPSQMVEMNEEEDEEGDGEGEVVIRADSVKKKRKKKMNKHKLKKLRKRLRRKT